MKGGNIPIGRQLEAINKRLSQAVGEIENRTAAGITLAALWAKGEAMKLCPVVTGNLRGSAFVTGAGQPAPIAVFRSTGPGNDKINAAKMQERHQAIVAESASRVAAAPASRPLSEVGFTAVYAMTVHENPRAGKTGGTGGIVDLLEAEREAAGSEEITWSRVGQWQFLATPLRRRKQILSIIAGEVTF